MLPRGTLLENRYRIETQVGEGGFGRVYRAFHEQLNKTVAIKELSFANLEEATRTQAQELFLREAQLLSQLTHPNLPRVTDYFTREQTNYLVMDFIEGEHLGAYAATFPDHRIPETEALTLIRPILDALDYLHSNEPPIVHRDIKPNNIIRTPEGKVYLIDFGLAKRDRGQRQNVATAGFASAGYTAPEQYHQQVDPRADLYSVGATLYTLLSGRIPPSATDRALELAATAHKTDPLDVLDTELTDVSSTTRAAVKRLLAFNAGERFQSAKEVRRMLEAPEKRQAVQTMPVGTAPEQRSVPPPDRKKPSSAKPATDKDSQKQSGTSTSTATTTASEKSTSRPLKTTSLGSGCCSGWLWLLILLAVGGLAWTVFAGDGDSPPPPPLTSIGVQLTEIIPSPEDDFTSNGETSNEVCTSYVVEQGDTLGKISVRFGVSVDAIIASNTSSHPEMIANPDLLEIGWELCIPPVNDETENYLHQGDELYKQGRLGEALELYRTAIEQNPKNAHAHNRLGNVLLDLGDAESALTAFGRTLDLNESYADAYFGRARAYVALDEIDLAIADLTRFLELSEDPTKREQAQALFSELQQ
ncbi:protein kinase [bacterium]|nr:protein kinase [bacterium]